MSDGLLLVHAFPLDARMWERQRFGATTVAPDLPGFGMTPSAGPAMTMALAADHCLHAADAAGLDRFVVCGLSMGGYVTFELWRRAKDRIAGLVLANTRAGADTPEAAAGRRDLATRLRSEGNVLAQNPPPLLAKDAPEELQQRVKGWVADQSAEAIAAAALGMADRPDSTGDLAGIDVPTLVITSDGDRLIPADLTTPMADQIPGARLEVLPGVGHLSNVEAADRFTALLREHVASCGIRV
ncbi:MAG TPA: alpha/beta fold hydrolase [Actinomycetota bacterium]|jgi:pimeloyl-ACP methyl ester carboxylesterase|nr:alpha/beta fold hydrolase [Actinomycetota bacterium]